MTDFTPITTQDQFDAAIRARLQREQETGAKKLADLAQKNADYEKQLSELQKIADDSTKKCADYDAQVKALTGKVAEQEQSALRARVAREAGLPYELASRISGGTETELRKDAETLAGLMAPHVPEAPRKSTEPAGDAGNTTAALKEALQQLRGE